MDTPAAPAQDRLDALIYEAAHLTVWLAGQLRGFLAPQAGKIFEAPFLREIMRDYVIPAEAALRRAIHLMATDMPPPPVRPRPLKPPPKVIPALWPVKQKKARPPAFRLTERQPRPSTDYLPKNLSPRIRILDPGAPASPPPAPKPAPREPASYEARLRRRVAALEAAIANPVREARRLQRLQARLKASRPLLSFTKIPGYRAKPLAEEGRSVLERTNAELLDCHLGRPNTS